MRVHQARAVCFDLDGVLIDTMPLHAKAWEEALRPLGMRVSRRVIYEREGEPGVVTARALFLDQRRPLSRRALTAALRDKERRFNRLARRINVQPRLLTLLRRLSRRGVRLGLVTGTSSREVRRVVPKRTLRLFDAVVTGDRVRHGKPHPEPYRSAFRTLRVPPNRTVVVENAPYGIRAGQRARAALVIALASSLPRRYLREADAIVTSVQHLCALLERLTGVDTASDPPIQ